MQNTKISNNYMINIMKKIKNGVTNQHCVKYLDTMASAISAA